ncbi:MAG: Appr-1-p processing protein [Deltaproteobacteria bacterium]|nr:Appr-1-p processing protein [Deltaproteobacteria bacterium]
MGRIELVEGDLVDQHVDCVVNAANTELWLGSGVAGAIRERGGDSIQVECEAHGRIGLGEVAVTGAGALPARYVIHAAVMERGGDADETHIRQATIGSLSAAVAHGCRSLALPALGAGVGGVSLQRCAEILMQETESHLASRNPLEEVRIVLWGEPAFRVFEMVQDASKVRAQMERMKAPSS